MEDIDIKLTTRDDNYEILIESLNKNKLTSEESIKTALTESGARDFKLVKNGNNQYEVIRILKG